MKNLNTYHIPIEGIKLMLEEITEDINNDINCVANINVDASFEQIGTRSMMTNKRVTIDFAPQFIKKQPNK